MLPIRIETLPDRETSLQTWKLVESKLAAIAAKEYANKDLEARDRIANNSIAYARYQASKKQWSDLWRYLLDRQIIAIGDVIKPKSVRSPKPSPVPKIAKQIKPRSPRKPKEEIRHEAFALIRLKSFALIWRWVAALIWGWIVYFALPCVRPKKERSLQQKSQGDRIKSLLNYKSNGCFYLKARLRRSGCECRTGSSVKALLVEKLGGSPASPAQCAANKIKGLARRTVSLEQLNQILTDKWQDVGEIAAKINEIVDVKLSFAQVSKLLSNRYRSGEIVRLENEGHHKISYYSRVQATEFENVWMTLDAAHKLARSRGCTVAKNTFRKNLYFDYALYGLEFRKEVPEPENCLLRWRDIWKDRNI